MRKNKFEFVRPEKYNGYNKSINKNIPKIKRSHYVVINQTLSGDAPKKFIKIYKYGFVRKKNKSRWQGYLAKTGHKWYPNESITELLLNKLGNIFGIKMAESMLMNIGGQVRFLSKFFLKPNQQLIHGAEIYAGYLMNDNNFINEIEKNNESRNFLTLQETNKAIGELFPMSHQDIFKDLIKMLLFDAWVGNNDRHFYNWGVIQDIYNKEQPIFSPVYDTARGLFWNYSEEKIISFIHKKSISEKQFTNYVNNSKPKIGWDHLTDVNHFTLIKCIYRNEIGLTQSEFMELFPRTLIELSNKIIDEEFGKLMSQNRIKLIKILLQHRFQEISTIINQNNQS